MEALKLPTLHSYEASVATMKSVALSLSKIQSGVSPLMSDHGAIPDSIIFDGKVWSSCTMPKSPIRNEVPSVSGGQGNIGAYMNDDTVIAVKFFKDEDSAEDKINDLLSLASSQKLNHFIASLPVHVSTNETGKFVVYDMYGDHSIHTICHQQCVWLNFVAIIFVRPNMLFGCFCYSSWWVFVFPCYEVVASLTFSPHRSEPHYERIV